MDGCVAQYVVANSRFLMLGLIIREFMRNANCYAVLQDAQKVTIIPLALQKLCLQVRIVFQWRWWPHGARGHNVGQAQPVVNMEFISVLIQTFFLLIPNWDFILHFPLEAK